MSSQPRLKPMKRTYNRASVSRTRAPKRPRKINYNRSCVDVPSKECAAIHKALALQEILQEIFQHLDVQSKGRAAQVSWSWHDAINQPKLWRGMTVALYYDEDDPSNYQIAPMEHVTCWGMNDDTIAIQPARRSFPMVTDLVVQSIATDKTISLIAKRFKNLVSLKLRRFYIKNRITDEAMILIVENLKSLRHLHLRDCNKITDTAVATLCSWNGEPSDGNVPTLHSLTLPRAYNITDVALRFLGLGQPDLHTLSVTECYNITGNGLQFLTRLAKLRVLNLKGCFGISDDGMIHLAHMVNLAELDLSVTFIGRAGLELLAASGDSRLTSLKLWGCSLVDDLCGQPLASLTHLTKLDLSHTSIGDKMLQCLAESVGASNIITLNLKECGKLTDEAGRHLAKMVNLRDVNLEATSIADLGFYHLANAVDSNIEILTLTKSEALTDVGLTHVARLPMLHKLKVCGCEIIATWGFSNPCIIVEANMFNFSCIYCNE